MEYLNFGVGPTTRKAEINEVASLPLPYFRTDEFSNITFDVIEKLKVLLGLNQGQICLLTGSGTLAMEMAIANCFNINDKVLVVDGGTFGHRFYELCCIYSLDVEVIKLSPFEQLTAKHLEKYADCDFKGFLINGLETSTGILYDLNLCADFCRQKNCLFILDAISCFLADRFDCQQLGVDVVLTGSQKGLALSPGLSIISLSPKACDIVNNNQVCSLYLDLKLYLKNIERGQCPFTPAVGIILELHKALELICADIDGHFKGVSELCAYFREKVRLLNLEIIDSNTNCLTVVKLKNAYDVFLRLKDEFKIWVTPNGGELRDEIIRVGHIGDLKKSDYDYLLSSLISILE